MRALLLSSISLILSAQDPIALEAPIQRVRLHPDEAWVTRAGKVRLPASGTHRIAITNLPAGLRVEDLQASAKGPAGLRLGDISVSSEVRVVTETPEWKKLEAERDGLREKRDTLESQGEAAQQEMTFLKGLQAAHDKELSTRMVYATPNAAPVLELSASVQKRLADLLGGERKRKRDLEKLSREEARLDAEMRKRSSDRRTAPTRVVVELSTPQEGSVELELGYRTRSARWRPLYEARLSEDRKKLDLVLYAAVTQNSGETWDDVRMEISNARPSRDLSVPVYSEGQTVNWEKEMPRPSVGYARDREAKMDESRNMVPEVAQMLTPPPPAPEPKEATESTATVIEEASGLAATFLVEGRKDVPSDNEPHRFKVLVKDVEPKLTVFTTPRLDAAAFLMARFSAPGGLPLFPGSPVVRFAGNQRLGEASLALPSAGQPFSLGFGPYKAARVSFRRTDQKLETVGTFSKERQWTLAERIELDNDGVDTLDMEVQDRILKSGSDQVKISPLPGFTAGWQEALPGVRTWTFKLAPKEHKLIELPISIRAPKDGVLTGLEGLNLTGE